jgi:fatty acyl-CoA reductase
VALEGDVGAFELGLDSEAKKLLKENTNIVFHVAASINFNAPLSNAIRSNLLGTRHVLEMAKSMPHLQVI